jgi:mercuric ion binding protein
MRSKPFVLAAVCGLVATTGSALALADTTVTLSKVHLCCPACVKGVADVVKKVDGATAECNRKDRTVTVQAKDEDTARRLVDALGEAGYYGTSDKKELAIKPAADVPSGKVKSLSVSGVHNCCGSCNRALKAAVKGVAGVTGDTAKPRSSSFEVTGDFDAADVVKALNDAGFQAKVK